MKILIDLERLRYPNTGIANVFRNIATGCDSHNANTYYFGPTKECSKYLPTEKIISYKKWHKFFDNFSNKFDIIHISHQGAVYFRKNYKKSIKILTLHDLNFLHENWSERKKKRVYNNINKSLRYVDYIVCISEFVRQDFLKNKHLFNLEKLKDVFVIHNGIEFPEQKKYDLGRFSFFENKKYILNIGVLFEKKNQKVLVEMLPYIDEDLVIVASEEKEPYATEVRDRIKELGVEHRVHFLEHISDEEKYALIQNCQAMCHATLAEGFGIPPIEAMVFGKPVFLSRFTALPEIGGEFAFYFDDFVPENMARIFKEKMEFYQLNREEWGDNLRKWASQFSRERMVKEYIDLYEKLGNK